MIELRVLAAGAAITIIGIWNHIDGPPLDKVGPVSDDRILSPGLNVVVYLVVGLWRLLLTTLGRTNK